MPSRRHDAAPSIGVARVIARRALAAVGAGLNNVRRVHGAADARGRESVASVLEDFLRLLGLGAERVSVAIPRRAPPMRVPTVLERPAVVRRASVEVRAQHGLLWNASRLAVRRVAEVPIVAHHDALVVKVRAVVAHWQHALVGTRATDVVGLHLAAHRHTERVEVVVREHPSRRLAKTLHAERGPVG